MVAEARGKRLKLEHVTRHLERERSGTHDVYLPPSRVRLDMGDPLGPGNRRYVVRLEDPSVPDPLTLTETSMRQLAGLAGVPAPFLERAPASLGVHVLRSCLALYQETSHDRALLFRWRESPRGPFLRAVLPSSFVRLNDREVLQQVQHLAEGRTVRATNLEVSEDVFFVRLILDTKLELGTGRVSDPAHVGVDVRTSETGRHSLSVRQVLFRTVCSNGLIQELDAKQTLRRGYAGLSPEVFRRTFGTALERAARWGEETAGRLGTARGEFVSDPLAETAHILRRYNLGSPRGRLARWVTDELMRSPGLLGVSRFDLVQAFTRVAQGLEHEGRLAVEEAANRYLFERN